MEEAGGNNDGTSCFPIIFDRLEMPTLKETMLVAVARNLWVTGDVITEIKSYYRHFSPTVTNKGMHMVKVTTYVLYKSLGLGLPLDLLEDLKVVIRQLGSYISMWMYDYVLCLFEKHFDIVVNYLCVVRLTLQGKIDNLKMMELVLDDDEIPIIDRYIAACNLCLEEWVCKLFLEIRTRHPKMNLLKECREPKFQCMYGYHLVNFEYWTKRMQGKKAKSHKSRNKRGEGSESDRLDMFRSAVLGQYVSFVRYSWSKLLPEEKQSWLRPALALVLEFVHSPVYSVDVMCFLLSQMDAEQQMSVFNESSPNLAIKFSLDFTVSLTFIFNIYPNICNNMINSDKVFFVHELCQRFPTFNIEPTFEVLWCKAQGFKHVILNIFDQFLMNFAYHDSIKCMKMLLLEVSTEDKENFMNSRNGIETCKLLIKNNKLAFFDELLQETLVAEESVMAYRERMMMNIANVSSTSFDFFTPEFLKSLEGI